jgi:hypothetical protein
VLFHGSILAYFCVVVLNGTTEVVLPETHGGATLVAQMGFNVFDGTTEVVLPGGATLVAQMGFVVFLYG